MIAKRNFQMTSKFNGCSDDNVFVGEGIPFARRNDRHDLVRKKSPSAGDPRDKDRLFEWCLIDLFAGTYRVPS